MAVTSIKEIGFMIHHVLFIPHQKTAHLLRKNLIAKGMAGQTMIILNIHGNPLAATCQGNLACYSSFP